MRPDQALILAAALAVVSCDGGGGPVSVVQAQVAARVHPSSQTTPILYASGNGFNQCAAPIGVADVRQRVIIMRNLIYSMARFAQVFLQRGNARKANVTSGAIDPLSWAFILDVWRKD